LCSRWAQATGAILSKEDAASWAIDRLPARMAATIDHARSAYVGPAEDDWSVRAHRVDALVRHVIEEIDAYRSS
jgi:hypothetical protein